jgi:hypothetical protein
MLPLLQQPAAAPSAAATRPGRDPQSGKPSSDTDVWGGLKTKDGAVVNTGDGISEKEIEAMAGPAVENSVEFLHRVSADSKNGTPVKYHYERSLGKFEGTAFADLTVRDSNVLIEVNVHSTVLKKLIVDYLAPDAKQNDKPAIGKFTLTGKINEAGEIGGIKVEASLGNLPKLSGDKLGELEENVAWLLEQLPVGGAITEEMKQSLGQDMKSSLKRSSGIPIEFFRDLINSNPVFNIDISGEKGVSKAHLKGGRNALDIQVDHALDEVGDKYPRIDGHTQVTLDKEDDDSVDLGTIKLYTTENLLVSFEGNKPTMYRIEADGSRTQLRDVFSEIFLRAALLPALVSKGGFLG